MGEVFTTTIHIHYDRDQPDLTEPRRCLLDTGSDVNLVSQRTLRMLSLSMTECEDSVISLGAQILLIGSTKLSWHVDCQEQKTYHTNFLVVADDIRPRFDFILGKDWIKENEALLHNPRVLLVHSLGSHFVLTSSSGGAQTSHE
jgi:hypothetical protein